MIDLTKKYRTEFGHAVILISGDGPDRDYPIVGYIVGDKRLLFFDRNGLSEAHVGKLVEVKEKLVFEAWINIIQFQESIPIATIYRHEINAKDTAQEYRRNINFKVLLEAEPYVREFKL